MPDAIVTPEEVASFLGGAAYAEDPSLVRLTEAVNQHVQRVCGRTFLYAERTEIVRGYGVPYVFLRESPIAALVEVRIDCAGEFGEDTIVALDQFAFETDVNRDSNILRWKDGRFPEAARAAQVTYSAGFHPIDFEGDLVTARMPQDLRTMIIDEICARAKRGSDEELKSASLGDYSFTRFDGVMNPSNRKILRSYRRQ